MTSFRFGHLKIDPVTYAIAGSAILGIRDSGKTYTATLLAERLFDAGIPFIAFDPIGVWRFLRVPGTGAGYPIVVAGGQEGDLSLTPASAPAIVEAAMQNGISLVIDLFSIDLSKADWRRIVRDSVRLLLHKNSRYGLRHIFIEEASEFVPQQVRDGDVYAEVEKLARMGGNAHLGYTLVNQRAEEVNKAVLELCDNLFLHRQKGRNSLTALSKWLDIGNVKDHREIIDSLSTLPTGECWAWLGGSERPERVKVPEKRSLHPDRRITREGKKLEAKAVDVGQFVATLREALPVIEKEAAQSDPKTLRARIAELEAENEYFSNQPLAQAPSAELLRAEYERGYLAGRSEAAKSLREHFAKLAPAIEQAGEALSHLRMDVGSWALTAAGPPPDAPQSHPISAHATGEARPIPSHSRPRAAAPRTNGHAPGESLPRAERRILTALAQYPHGRSKVQIAVLTGYASNGGGFSNAISALRTRGYLEGDSAHLIITPSGMAALGTYTPLPRGRALLDHWLAQLGKAERKALESLAEVYPRTLSKAQLAARAGYEANGGGFNNALSRLRTLELVRGKAELKASEELFG